MVAASDLVIAELLGLHRDADHVVGCGERNWICHPAETGGDINTEFHRTSPPYRCWGPPVTVGIGGRFVRLASSACPGRGRRSRSTGSRWSARRCGKDERPAAPSRLCQRLLAFIVGDKTFICQHAWAYNGWHGEKLGGHEGRDPGRRAGALRR